MKTRIILSSLAACAVLVPLSACDSDSAAEPDSARGRGGTSAAGEPGSPAESRAKGSKDPDDINGDGHRDLMIPVAVGGKWKAPDGDQRIAVIYGSSKGLVPATHTVYGRRDLGLPDPPADRPATDADSVSAADVVSADLDGDGFPDFVTAVVGEDVEVKTGDGRLVVSRTIPYVTWGGPAGPGTGTEATPVRLPGDVSTLGVQGPVTRGDFDGDGHHDIAALGHESSLVVMYGPFTRSGVPARTAKGPAGKGALAADDIDPSGKARATSLLLRGESDGEQSSNTLFEADRGTGLSTDGKKLRVGNGYAFGDFDGDGRRDVAVGDSGSRNDEPGEGKENPEVEGSLAVYPGDGGESVKQQLPRAPKDGDGVEHYEGPGGFMAADPDGDGRDGVLVATYEGATLIDGDRRLTVGRTGPTQAKKGKDASEGQRARPVAAADFDADGKDEIVFDWGDDGMFESSGAGPTHWWVTDGMTSMDKTSFKTTDFVRRSS
ncbi:hypothetical protein AB0912_33815 [Streptomyces sp. NPDC007084]|uniref:hypothetical protein n=1 Tax=Streptomyces sp. NPDC007084 TaxID=3154313 RepID=UPI00345638ED